MTPILHPKQRARVLITGSAGFIGFHLSELLISQGNVVHGYDGMTDYYDVKLKRSRHNILMENANFSATEAMLEEADTLNCVVDDFQPDVIVHLAAQAGVRYSLTNPQSYLSANVIGTFNVLEAARRLQVKHLLIASTSSIYGANQSMPFSELDQTDTQLTIYSATKKAAESMAHAYAHLWKLPTTVFRFFTVYGPWGRPDMALYKFVDAILNGQPIDIYNHGEMYRDFTFVTDLTRAIQLLINTPPVLPLSQDEIDPLDSLSPVAPFRIINIGNSQKVRLLDFIEAIEEELGRKAIRNYLPMQPGDVPATWADATLLNRLTGYKPHTGFRQGIAEFVAWYLEHQKSSGCN